MILPSDIAQEFLSKYTKLLCEVGDTSVNDWEEFVSTRDEFHNNKAKYLPYETDLEFRAALKDSVYGDFVPVKIGKRKCIITQFGSDAYYDVVGVTQELGEIVDTWTIYRMAVIYYRGHLFVDGLFTGGNMMIGPNIKRDILDGLKSARIITGDSTI